MVQNRWGWSGICGDGPGWVGIMGSRGGVRGVGDGDGLGNLGIGKDFFQSLAFFPRNPASIPGGWSRIGRDCSG